MDGEAELPISDMKYLEDLMATCSILEGKWTLAGTATILLTARAETNVLQ